AVGVPWGGAEGWHFDGSLLEACLRQPPEWKQRHHFPQDLEEILTVESDAGPGAPPSWQRVIVDRPERLAVVLALAPAEEGGESLVGFPVQQEGWTLQAAKPAFILGAGWQETFPDLTHEPDADAWRQAWQAWCRPRNLPAGEVDASVPERHDYRLRVQTGPR